LAEYSQLPAVLHFLRSKPGQVSGFKIRGGSHCSARSTGEDEGHRVGEELLVYERFCSALEETLPGLLGSALSKLEKLMPARGKDVDDHGFRKKIGLWQALKDDTEDSQFGFGEGLVEDDELGEVPW
jgi:hypothetical protein